MMLLLFFGAKSRKRLDKHRGNFVEGAKFLVFRCMRQAFLMSIMLLLYNIRGNFAEGEKFLGDYFAEGEKFWFFPGTEQKSPA